MAHALGRLSGRSLRLRSGQALRSAEKRYAQDDTAVYDTECTTTKKVVRLLDLHSGSSNRYPPGEADPSRCEQQQLPGMN
jgi:hypothetical protein